MVSYVLWKVSSSHGIYIYIYIHAQLDKAVLLYIIGAVTSSHGFIHHILYGVANSNPGWIHHVILISVPDYNMFL